MSRKSSRIKEDEQRISERAAEWLHVLEDAGPEERTEFMEWVARSPHHLEEFLLVSAVDQEMQRLDLPSLAVVQESLAGAADNIVALESRLLPSPPRRDGVRRWSAGIAAGLLAFGAFVWYGLAGRGHLYTTQVGEQRIVRLADGTAVHLNTRSRIGIDFSGVARDIRLLEGEALFDVARDSARPFRVYSGVSVIQALGTQFDVTLRPLGTTVAVIEGAVQISTQNDRASPQPSAAPSPIRFQAGEEARIDTAGRIEQRRNVDAPTATAWQQRRLEFWTDALADIAAQFNRYNAAPQIEVIGEDVRRRHYSGVFDADDPKSLLEFLRQDPDLALEERDGKLIIRAR